MSDAPNIELPVDRETVQLYLHDPRFKHQIDTFIAEVWPTFLAGAKTRAAAWSAQDEAARLAMEHGHPLTNPPLLHVVKDEQ